MSTPIRRTPTSIAEKLYKEPHSFEFFQAVRVLKWLCQEQRSHDTMPCAQLGSDALPQNEIVRFCVANSFNFPVSAVANLHKIFPEEAGKKHLSPQMDVTFMGLSGPGGVLPEHYTQLLQQRTRNHKDNALRDFLDIFNHRSISFFYRAWEKYRVPFVWEQSQLDSNKEDLFTQSLSCLVGLGTPKLKERLQVSDEIPLYYAGYFSQRLRSASVLKAMLSDYLQLSVKIVQFQGRWLTLENEERTRLPKINALCGQYNQLGVDAVLGEKAWDVCSSFHIRIESLTYSQFLKLLPKGRDYKRLCHLTRLYVDTSLTFAVQPVMREKELPMCKLGGAEDKGFHLGWNTWLTSTECPASKKQTDAPIFFWKDISN